MPGILLVIMAASLWGTNGTAQALAPDGATPVAVGTMRIAIGGITLLLVARLSGATFKGEWPRLATITAIVMTALYQVLFFAGVNLAGVAIGTLVGIGSAPIFAGMLDYAATRDPLPRVWFAATALAILGAGLLTLSSDAKTQVNEFGILLAIGAGLAYATFTLASKSLLAKQSAEPVMAVVFCGAAMLLAPALLFVDTGWIVTPRGGVVVLHLGVIATGLAYVFFGRGLKTVSVATTGTLTLAEPLTAALLGVLLLGERITPLAAVGIALLFGGLALLAVGRRES